MQDGYHQPSDAWLQRMADAERRCPSVAVGGLASDFGMLGEIGSNRPGALGRFVAYSRIRRGMSKQQLAALAGIGMDELEAVEATDEEVINSSLVCKIAEALEMPLDRFLLSAGLVQQRDEILYSSEAVRQRYREIRARIDAAAERCGRPGSSVLLVVVTSDAELDQIRALVEIGHRDFGEHQTKSLVRRAAAIDKSLSHHRRLCSERGRSSSGEVRWHMLGEIARRRLRDLTEVAQFIHSVDALRVAEDLNNATLNRAHPVDILLNVNASLSKSGGGLSIPAAAHVAELIHAMFHLRLRGLTTTVAAGASEGDVRATYRRCRELFQEIQRSGVAGRDFNLLCMGVSADFEIAVEEGANVVRIDSALFGPQKRGASIWHRESAR